MDGNFKLNAFIPITLTSCSQVFRRWLWLNWSRISWP